MTGIDRHCRHAIIRTDKVFNNKKEIEIMSIRTELKNLPQGTTWDEVRECGLVELDDAQNRLLESSYYGYPLTSTSIASFLRGEPINLGKAKYGVKIRACDGSSFHKYKTLRAAQRKADGILGHTAVLDSYDLQVSDYGVFVSLVTL